MIIYWLFPVYEQRTLYGALIVTLAMILRLINCRFIIIIIIIALLILSIAFYYSWSFYSLLPSK